MAENLAEGDEHVSPPDYERPSIIDLGTLAEMTQGTPSGTGADIVFAS